MKRTHKLKAIGNVAEVTAGAGSLTAKARRLGVHPSTLWRWRKAGKIKAPASARLRDVTTAESTPAPEPQTPAAWALAVRTRYDLTDAETQLLALAEMALTLAHDETQTPNARLAAAGRFQTVLKDLHLEVEDTHGEAETGREWPRRIG